MEQLGLIELAETDRALRFRVLEFQLVAILDDGWAANRSGRQYQHTRKAQKSVVGAFGRHRREPRRGVLRSMHSGRPGGASRSIHLALGRHPVRPASRYRPVALDELLQARP